MINDNVNEESSNTQWLRKKKHERGSVRKRVKPINNNILVKFEVVPVVKYDRHTLFMNICHCKLK